MALNDITMAAVVAALNEFDQLGSADFLAKYGFAESKAYWLLHEGKRYPSKAIAGVAHKYVDGSALDASEFSGGENTVARKLRQLGFKVESPGRNPDWTRDELILALDLYLANPASPPGHTSAALLNLSGLLNKMHRLTGTQGNAQLRNTNGVYLKMMNFRALDPAFVAQGMVGMKSGGNLDQQVWNEYLGRRSELAADALAIRESILAADEVTVASLPQCEPYEGEEGGIVTRLHKRYERDPKLVAEKRKEVAKSGQLSCEVCSLNFGEKYGHLGEGYIEVHHINPLHQLKQKGKTKLSDLALLCSNCHRMAHRKRIPLSLEALRNAIKSS